MSTAPRQEDTTSGDHSIQFALTFIVLILSVLTLIVLNPIILTMTTHIPLLTLPSVFFSQPAAAILLPVAIGTAIGFSMRPKETQKTYLALRQPPLRPPPWIFGPMWTLLYGLMGYAAHRAWTTGMGSSFNPSKVMLTKVR